MPKDTLLDLSSIAKELGTKVKKGRFGSEFVKYNLSTIKGQIYNDDSGGMYFKPKDLGLDCYIDHGTVLEQIKEMEDQIAAYNSLLPDLKRIKRAVLKGTRKLPEKSNDLGSTKTSKVVSRSSRRAEKASAAKKGRG